MAQEHSQNRDRRRVTTDEQLEMLNQLFDRASGYPSSKEYVELGKLSGLAHKYILNWFSRKRYPKKRKRCSTGSETDDCRSSSPMSVKTEIPKDLPLEPQPKKVKVDQKLDKDAIALLKTEIAEATIPPSPQPASINPHTSSSDRPSTKDVHSSPVATTEIKNPPQSHTRDPPVYSSPLDTDKFILCQPAMTCAQQPVLPTIPNALTAPLASHSDFPLHENSQHYSRNLSVALHQVQQVYHALLASASTLSGNTQTQIAAQYQPQLQPYVFSQPQPFMQPNSTIHNQPGYSQQLLHASIPAVSSFEIQSELPRSNNEIKQESIFPPQGFQIHSPDNVASGRVAPAPAPLCSSHTFADPYTSMSLQSHVVPSALQPSQPEYDPSLFPTSAQFASVTDNSHRFQHQSYFEALDSGMTPLQHLHVLEPFLNANSATRCFPFSTIDTFDAEDIRNLLLPQNTDEVVGHLLNERLVEEDPFQASMGLVWMQRVGLIQ
ncbi:hypothetical protein J3R30DRAFT_3699719 [Lentinula aciculospora]|uniref:Homeobox domain-containing protein n=1 Tax=Lentinula aciculospora TaxID=153920 RepID=A0A9W9DR12_9AGAR|nr:hypothetical protein J3R30DRAFT_3699719 [Lentinula aciculospora]